MIGNHQKIKKKLIEVGKDALNSYNNIINLIEKAASNEIIYKAIHKTLKLSVTGSIVKALWELVINVSLGDAFSWGKITIFLFLLKIIHVLSHYGSAGFKKFGNFYSEIKRLYNEYKEERDNNIQEFKIIGEQLEKLCSI